MESSKEGKKAIISEVLRQGGRSRRIGPIVVKFEHAELKPESINDFDLPIVEHDFESKNEIPLGEAPSLKVELKLDGTTYSSNAKSVRCNGPQYLRNFLAIRNKKTNKTRLVEVNNVTLGAITSPPSSTNHVLALLKQEDNKSDANNNAPDIKAKKKEEQYAKNKSLIQEFGQTKGKRMYSQNDRMQVNPEVLQDKLSKAAMSVEEPSFNDSISLENLLTKKKNSASLEMELATLIPPCNRNATEVELVYSLENGILNQREIAQLQSAATSLAEEYNSEELIREGIRKKVFSEYFGKILIKEHKEIESIALAVAIYMEGIIKFIGINRRDFTKGPKGMSNFIPLELREKIFRVFTNDQNNIDPTSRDSAICYVIILALMISKYRIEFSDLTSSIRIKSEHLKKLIKVTGARIFLDADKITRVQLKLPLEIYDPSAQFKRKNNSNSKNR